MSRIRVSSRLRATTLAAAMVASASGAPGTEPGSIVGRVSFEGEPPAPERIAVSGDPRCVEARPDGLLRQPIRLSDGGVADTLVFVRSEVPGAYPPPAEPVLLDQVGCSYVPEMLVARVGQPIQIRNSDPTLHNVHPRPTVNQEFNVGQPRQGMVSTRTFSRPELMIPVGCDIHPWMRAHLSVMSHPFFAVSGADGSYEITGLPPGEYVVEARHGLLPPAQGTVVVEEGRATQLMLVLAPEGSPAR